MLQRTKERIGLAIGIGLVVLMGVGWFVTRVTSYGPQVYGRVEAILVTEAKSQSGFMAKVIFEDRPVLISLTSRFECREGDMIALRVAQTRMGDKVVPAIVAPLCTHVQ